jgi:putative phosphoesterase
MLIGLISDTHVGDRVEKLPVNLSSYFKDVELILHAGDLTSLDVITELEKIAPTIAVQGNMDRFYDIDLPESHVETIDGVKIGIKHGEVYPKGDTQQLEYIARELEVDVLVSGHTHQALIEQANDILLVNPGSPTVPLLTDPTVMLMTIEDGEVDVEVIKLGPPTCSALNFKKD